MPASSKSNRKLDFIDALAHFLVDDQGRKSIELEVGKSWANEWAAVRNSLPTLGYATHAEAVKFLTEFLMSR